MHYAYVVVTAWDAYCVHHEYSEQFCLHFRDLVVVVATCSVRWKLHQFCVFDFTFGVYSTETWKYRAQQFASYRNQVCISTSVQFLD